MSMEYYEVRNWLDAIVETIERQKQLVQLNSSIKTHNPRDFYWISTGIEIIADVMGLKLDCTVKENTNYPYQYTLLYRNIEFVQSEDKPLEGVDHERV